MKKLLLIPLTASLLAGCEARVETPAAQPSETKVEKNTTVVNPPSERKTENNTTIVNPPNTSDTTTTPTSP